MAAPWPSEEARERYIRFLELELLVMDLASRGEADGSVLAELNALLKEHFPRAADYIRKKLECSRYADAFDAVSTVAWAEARSVADESGVGHVPGGWTTGEIAADIRSCWSEARGRLDL